MYNSLTMYVLESLNQFCDIKLCDRYPTGVLRLDPFALALLRVIAIDKLAQVTSRYILHANEQIIYIME